MGFRWFLPEICVNAYLYNHHINTQNSLTLCNFASQSYFKNTLSMQCMLNQFDLYLLWSCTYRKKHFYEVGNRASKKGSGYYTEQNSWQCSSFLQWYYVKIHKKLRYKLMSSKHEICLAFIRIAIVTLISWFRFKSFISLKEKYILAYNADTLRGDAIIP